MIRYVRVICNYIYDSPGGPFTIYVLHNETADHYAAVLIDDRDPRSPEHLIDSPDLEAVMRLSALVTEAREGTLVEGVTWDE